MKKPFIVLTMAFALIPIIALLAWVILRFSCPKYHGWPDSEIGKIRKRTQKFIVKNPSFHGVCLYYGFTGPGLTE